MKTNVFDYAKNITWTHILEVKYMKWLKSNHYIILLFGLFLLLFVIFAWRAPDDITFNKITIVYGDTLWSLAEQYRGSMSSERWIEIVMIENDLQNVSIIAGKSLIIPISEHMSSSENFEIARDEQS